MTPLKESSPLRDRTDQVADALELADKKYYGEAAMDRAFYKRMAKAAIAASDETIPVRRSMIIAAAQAYVQENSCPFCRVDHVAISKALIVGVEQLKIKRRETPC